MKLKIFATVLALAMTVGSFAFNFPGNDLQEGVIYVNPFTGEEDHTDCVPGNYLCWYRMQ